MTPFITIAATVTCPHGAPATLIPSNTRVLAGGAPIAVLSDMAIVAGCVFTLPGPVPQPCVTAAWLVGATRVLVGGQPALIVGATGLCKAANQAPAGPPIVAPAQTSAMGS